MYQHMSDIYMTPYLSKEQAVSGTLAYAVGCGRVVVSTPYLYAREMLTGGRGMLAEFRDSCSLAFCLDHILRNPLRKRAMEHKKLTTGRTMTWDKVGSSYTQLFMEIMEEFQPNVAEAVSVQRSPSFIKNVAEFQPLTAV